MNLNGIDEICLMKDDYHRKQPWAIIANGDENTVIEMLRNRSKPSVIEFLQSLKSPKNVEVVTMDMWSGYRRRLQGENGNLCFRRCVNLN